MKQDTFNTLTWTAFLGSAAIGFIAWGQTVNWNFGSLNAYQWFPLLGILAWLIMWTHYITGSIRIQNPDLKKVVAYSKISSYVVLACLILHPAILAIAQFQNDQGLPPQSYVSYAGESLRIAVFLGVIGVTIFLSFEIFERLKNNPTVKKYWWAVSISQSLAMILIFIHGLQLGTSLGSGWFRFVWVIYGAALIPCFYLIHRADFSKK